MGYGYNFYQSEKNIMRKYAKESGGNKQMGFDFILCSY
jgi:hypothetical protein